jgi:hypothetical protein
MTYKVLTCDEHFRNDGGPKRILALDGGGLRGILTLGILEKIENLLMERNGGGADFRLCHYFDLIAGTSTGSIIAAALAQGWSVHELRDEYFRLGQQIFKKSYFRRGLFRAKYSEHRLTAELREIFGENTTLGSEKIHTGLLIITKRLDTGSPWPISNNPNGRYFRSGSEGRLGNGDYPLWQVVRASTAAPHYFKPETLTITNGSERRNPVVGNFVDGGVSPYNNPSLQALMYSTIEGYRINWELGPEQLLLVSIGTGTANPIIKTEKIAARHAVRALLSLMQDSSVQQENILQWLSDSPTARTIDRELGNLNSDLLCGTPLLTYLRYDVDLQPESIRALAPEITSKRTINSLSVMDAPQNMKTLHKLGILAGERDVQDNHLLSAFDLAKL